jgi:hypothetical protein
MTLARAHTTAKVATLSMLAAVAIASSALAQVSNDSYPARCGVGGVASDRGGYIPLPRGDVFCPLIADPKATRSFVAYQRGDEKDLATDIGAVGIADQFPFFRAGATRAAMAFNSASPARCSRNSTSVLPRMIFSMPTI